jgi:hypothetical protein
MAEDSSEKGEGGQQKRRNPKILSKLAGWGLAATAAVSLLTGCDTSAKGKGELSSSEVPNHTTLLLNVSGQGQEEVIIVYANGDIDPLKIRTTDGVLVTKGFNAGDETARYLGEITDPSLEKIEDSTNDIIIYPKVTGSLVSNFGAKDLPEDLNNLYAIPVIMPDTSTPEGPLPTETNANFVPGKPGGVVGFSQGLAIGRLNSEDQFTVLGYIPSAENVTLK